MATEILGREGETKADMLEWFRRRGFWKTTDDQCFVTLIQLNAYQLDILAGAVTHYGIEKERQGEAKLASRF